MTKSILAIAFVFCATACDKKDASETALPSAEPAPPTPAAVDTTPADPMEELMDEIPTPEDFEEEAAEDIDYDNMEEELDRLEDEING